MYKHWLTKNCEKQKKNDIKFYLFGMKTKKLFEEKCIYFEMLYILQKNNVLIYSQIVQEIVQRDRYSENNIIIGKKLNCVSYRLFIVTRN